MGIELATMNFLGNALSRLVAPPRQQQDQVAASTGVRAMRDHRSDAEVRRNAVRQLSV